MKIGTFLMRMCGRKARAADVVPPRQPVLQIPGARAARELCCLATDYSPADKGPWISQLKADGLRCLFIDGRVLTREGGTLDAARHAIPGLVRLEAAFGQPMMLDAEYVAEAGYGATMSEFKSGEGTGVVWVFDAIPLADWQSGRCETPFSERLAALEAHAAAADSPFVGVLGGTPCEGDAAVQAMFEQVARIKYEGIVLKRPDSPYVRERFDAWRKLKVEIVADVPVLDMLFKGLAFQGLLVRGPEGRPLKITNGFSSMDRAAFSLMVAQGASSDGGKVRIRYNEIAGTNTPRAPRFVGVVA